MARLGILFDIDNLGGGLHGMIAYQTLFAAVDTRRIPGACFRDGVTRETLAGQANHYCIAVDTADPAQLRLIRDALSTTDGGGLLPLSRRFLEEAEVSREPLVIGAVVAADGALTGDGGGWVTSAWLATRCHHNERK